VSDLADEPDVVDEQSLAVVEVTVKVTRIISSGRASVDASVGIPEIRSNGLC
jgi:hypothetical protein